ncbi:carbohydrate ABC transporter permease [Paenibacillus cymbidii]|uniref:carbohydrate ABC transporter permease n=1 Tax=Paenibacillus cymbidii TaxID=1639034 RepID=UPI0010806275|nr:carbohydrate ABC transporter permease [Paenibacillus cymbidii]
MKKRSFGGLLFDGLNTLFMVLVVFVMAFPFLYVLNYSISDPAKVGTGLMLVPAGINFEAYRIVLSDPDIVRGFFISVCRTIVGPLAMLLLTSMAAYVLTRSDMPGIKALRRYFVFTLYFSAGIIPTYLLIQQLQLIGTLLVYIVPGMVGVFNMVLIKTYMESIPKSLEEAALIDGANDFVVYARVMLPVSMPVLAAVTLFSSVGHWNAYIDTQLYNTMYPENYTLQYYLYNLLAKFNNIESLKDAANHAQTITPKSLQMAMTIVTVVPIMLVYPILQRYFVKGLLIGSIKG